MRRGVEGALAGTLAVALSWLAASTLGCSGKILGKPQHPGAGDSAGGDSDDTRCTTGDDCPPEASYCQTSTGQCLPRTCLTEGCPPGTYCDLTSLACTSSAPGDHPTYRAETIVGHNIQQPLGARDAVGIAALGDFFFLVASAGGRYLYVVDDAVLRVDQATMRVETLSGLGWPGEVDGPAEIAQFETNTYQAGGIALSPDERYLYFTATHAVRRVDLESGEASTVAPAELAGFSVRGLATGDSGALYLSGWGTLFYVIQPDGTVEARPVDATQAWAGNGGGPPGYIGVDEARGWIYGLERNLLSGAFYRWPVAGGAAEWLNSAALGTRDPIQYLSDGPVANLDMANPGALTIDAQGIVYIGAGDGSTFRRFLPDEEIVESLCAVADADPAEHLMEWCIGDGVRNRLFGTWPSFLTFDAAGNGYFGYTVWPRLVRLRRED